jgi:methionyl-tRNA synthetase
MSNKYFITTSIPYVNSSPHVGHAQEFALADAIARFYRLQNTKVILQSGTDDNAFKNVLSAKEAGIETKTFVDQNARSFQELLGLLDISADYFVRTSSKEHAEGVAAFIKQLDPNDLYTSSYIGLYCQGCEDFYSPSELVNGLCPDHQKAPEKIEEENTFFRLSKYQQEIYRLIESDQVLITPQSRKKEVLNFISTGLTDISISRSSARSSGWGIPFPGRPDQVVYVWIDALINYLTGAGFGRTTDWSQVWNQDVYKVHVIGKNVWKFHAIYWVGLLLSANLPLPNEIFIHGFLTNNGVKISKSLKNGGDLSELIRKYGSDALRFYLLSGLSVAEDADFSESNLVNVYNTELANKIGNLTSRILTLRNRISEKSQIVNRNLEDIHDFSEGVREALNVVSRLNFEIETTKPWELLKRENHSELADYLQKWITDLGRIAILIAPVVPRAATRIHKYIAESSLELKPLFPRI